VGHSHLYALDSLVLELDSEEPLQTQIDGLLRELSWVRVEDCVQKPTLHLCVRSTDATPGIPRNCHEVLRAGDFTGYEAADEFYLTDGASLLHLGPRHGKAYARIASSFSRKSEQSQANFWCFGLLKLLRPLGIYSLHAAALAAVDGSGLLLSGAPGSGKSTLAIGLIREGWKYLSDDAVLLRDDSERVEALACRRSFYIDAIRSQDYADLSLGDEIPDSNGRERCRVEINEVFGAQHVRRCVPRMVIFPRIKSLDQSTVGPIDRLSALGLLLSQSAPQLFDRATMVAHLELLKRLLNQCELYQLDAGIDLYRDPAKLIELIGETRGKIIGTDRY